ncbi:phytanoyl-CoA dioxygenase family protein [Azospirillum canadense]|uniref:phytanoyl-CoA dioxygenase family protein n=1 Tax=Azospirillum canadense TaxID=403962 RepID=UPI0022278DFE|nr:phytanoyl-CoA dioxygenase family protein [Azospirillum canadense]MCW2240930.1 hypothetical protein [Azospirillum canadense]
MIEYAKLTPGAGFSPVNAALYYSQRLVQQRRIRSAIAKAIARFVNAFHPMEAHGSKSQSYPTSTVVDIERNGYAVINRLADDKALFDIEQFLQKKEVLGPDGQQYFLSDLPSGTCVAPYPLETVLRCPHVLALANHPMVLSIAKAYLGCKPTLSSIGIRWTFPTEHPGTDVQRFHRDVDDWRTLKLFVYLTDVDEESGPHTYVAGSHRTPGSIFARSYNQAELLQQYGPDSLRSILGPHGTTFLADVHGIHCGAVPINRPRLMLQIQYSLLPIYAFMYRPMTLPVSENLDMYINRLLLC